MSLRAANKALRTQQTYAEGIEQFDDFLASKGMPRYVSAIRREHVIRRRRLRASTGGV